MHWGIRCFRMHFNDGAYTTSANEFDGADKKLIVLVNVSEVRGKG